MGGCEFGGGVQLVAAVLEIVRGSLFGAVVFGSFGTFWTIYALEFVLRLPKTATGKVQTFELRAREWSAQERRIRGWPRFP